MRCLLTQTDARLNRLTGDVRWPVSTLFEDAVGTCIPLRLSTDISHALPGPLAGDFPILSLRTNKADVVVGVPQEVADKLDAAGEKWRVNGKYALVSFLPRQE